MIVLSYDLRSWEYGNSVCVATIGVHNMNCGFLGFCLYKFQVTLFSQTWLGESHDVDIFG